MAPHPDVQNMEQVILDSPKQFVDGINAAREVQWDPPTISRILVAGLGGSWMAAGLLTEAKIAKIPVTIHRTYDLPSDIPDGTLVIASSYSGNTEETVSAYDEARKRSLPMIAIASGGTLAERCEHDGVPFFRIPADPPTMQPRSATGYSVGILTEILKRMGGSAPDAVEEVEGLGAYLAGFQETARDRGGELAAILTKTTPVIYASDRFAVTASLWKIKINENGKTPAFWNIFPELNHNEMIGWTRPQGAFHVVMLRADDDHPRVKRRMDITASLLQESDIHSTVVPIEGKTRLQQVFSTLLVGDWMSYQLAVDAGIDPSPVAMVEDLKRQLKE